MARILILGCGGREHALALALSGSHRVSSIHVSPGNAGTHNTPKCRNVTLDLTNFHRLGEWCKDNRVDLVVVGPEDPLANGIVDALSKFGVHCFGPCREAAQIESSKAFAKAFMDRHGIPTARWKAFTDAQDACTHIDQAPYQALVVKASGLAAGKGVIVAATKAEAKLAVTRIMQDEEFGEAGRTVVVEELLEGHEISVLALCDGEVSACFPAAQDHKRVGDGDTGPNTGGMGAYAPCPLISGAELELVRAGVIQKAVDGMREDGHPYKGVLYAGLMMTSDGPKVLEYNCRFGDPETQVLLPLLRSDLYEALMSCVLGRMASSPPEFHTDRVLVAVVVVSGGYPGAYEKGHEIRGVDRVEQEAGLWVIHAGTTIDHNGRLLAAGGRVLATVSMSTNLATAITKANAAADLIEFEGAFHRKDIGKRALNRSLSYVSSGVSISAGNEVIRRIAPHAKQTSRPGCQVELGMFGGMFDLRAAEYKDPLLVAGTDGVGTKLKIAQAVGDHSTIGQDLVAMCVNDVLAHGAEPLFFLDYFACGQLDVQQTEEVVRGVARACREAGCALLGGETAEMPGMYQNGEYDLAGFTVGAVGRHHVLPRIDDINVDDVIIGVASSGIHSNGYSLVRKVVESGGYDYSIPCPYENGITLGRSLLTPTRLYVRTVLPALRSGRVKALAHITGGGLLDNLPRVLPKHLAAHLDASTWRLTPVFRWLAKQGNITEQEMARTFNCGLGLALITSSNNADHVVNIVTSLGEEAWRIGTLQERKTTEGEAQVIIQNLSRQLGLSVDEQTRMGPGGDAENCQQAANGHSQHKMRVGVLISGSGTNLQALMDHCAGQGSAAEIVLVVSNVDGVKGLERAHNNNIPTKVISHICFSSREEFDREVDSQLKEAEVELVCLAGFMRILSAEFTKTWSGRLLNVHPSLLPAFKGAHAHKLALEAGVTVSGCTVHFVTEAVDEGAILVQEPVCVYPGDSVESLQTRVKAREHVAYPRALQLVASGRARLDPCTNKVVWQQ